ncbi:hypothetical protein BDV95DRAFT_544992 [Massariosphaeria phaeospora]|uniref:Rhodopsin domain-containing protein n=1 Tax=Massariosphaeria phaeospora TaxID=100035 RepID=A0A7C8MJZ7_9PLEO|nr:hypothetical protein BDV95DRAFT_544992 [Massariosphaeria phaeospora]
MHTHAPGWTIFTSTAIAQIGYQALVPALVFTFTAMFVLFLRMYARITNSFERSDVRLRDFFIVAAWANLLSNSAQLLHDDGLSSRRQEYESRTDMLRNMMKLVFAQSIFYHLGINLAKTSIVVEYYSAFRSLPSVRTLCCILLVLIQGAMIYGIGGFVLICDPVRKYWTPLLPGQCSDPSVHFRASSIIGIVLDVSIWILPMPIIGTLNLARKQRIALWGVFGLGGFVCTTSVLRLFLTQAAADDGNVAKSGTYATVWSTTEINVAIICNSLLFMKPLLLRWFPRLLSEPPTPRDPRRDMPGILLRRSITLQESDEVKPGIRVGSDVSSMTLVSASSTQDSRNPSCGETFDVFRNGSGPGAVPKAWV